MRVYSRLLTQLLLCPREVAEGMESGRFGLAVAEVGKRGKERISGAIPGMRSAMTFWNIWTFLE